MPEVVQNHRRRDAMESCSQQGLEFHIVGRPFWPFLITSERSRGVMPAALSYTRRTNWGDQNAIAVSCGDPVFLPGSQRSAVDHATNMRRCCAKQGIPRIQGGCTISNLRGGKQHPAEEVAGCRSRCDRQPRH